METERYDVVIVGGGAAGCVLAARLSEAPGRRVLLLEAGPDYGPEQSGWPEDLRDPVGIKPDSHPWGYLNARPSAGLPFGLPRGKVLGGSTTINGCIWLRGSRRDYDAWAAAGNPGWGFADLLPFFKKAEADPLGPNDLHGADGPVPVYRIPEGELPPVDRAFVDAATGVGFPWIADLNGGKGQEPAIGPSPKNVAAGVRMNGAFTYLGVARSRSNLTIRCGTLVDRVVVEDGRATGVRDAAGRIYQGAEVVLAGGTYGSPAILLRSGIGPADHLRALGIGVVRELPGVGEHLLDHPNAPSWSLRRPIRAGYEPKGISFVPTILTARSRQSDEEIDLHLYPIQTLDAELGTWTLDVAVILQLARSRGTVRLTSPDPAATLAIDHCHLDDPVDLEALCDGVDLAGRLFATPPLAGLLAPNAAGQDEFATRDALRSFVRDNVGTTYHPSSTCRMGPASDPLAVVDHHGRVYGLAGLRVVDASIFPAGPRCNIHWPTIAVAEKLAATIASEA